MKMEQTASSQRFDAIVLGGGPAGEVVITQLSERGMSLALVEPELVGGECAYWACIPSKTLLRPPEVRSEALRTAGTSEPAHRWDEIREYRDYMIRNLDDTGEVKSYEGKGVRVVKGAGRFAGPGEVEVDGHRLLSDRIVIATGSQPAVPSIPGLEQAGYWTNREATTLTSIPESVVILGGGPVGVELAQIMRRFGASVTLLEAGELLLSREDPRVSELLLEGLSEDGIDVRCEVEVSSVAARNGYRVVRLANGDELRASELVVAVGRKPRLENLSLERAGIEPTEAGLEVDERCRAADGVWAVGDVTGVMPFTHVAMYQGRVAAADMAGEPVRADYTAIPRVVFSDPEVAAVGMTSQQARESGIDVDTSHLQLDSAIARPWTYETDPRGELAVIADRNRKVLVGAWAVAPLASEWIHFAALAIKAQVPIAVLSDTVAQFPTYTEAYRKAIERLG